MRPADWLRDPLGDSGRSAMHQLRSRQKEALRPERSAQFDLVLAAEDLLLPLRPTDPSQSIQGYVVPAIANGKQKLTPNGSPSEQSNVPKLEQDARLIRPELLQDSVNNLRNWKEIEGKQEQGAGLIRERGCCVKFAPILNHWSIFICPCLELLSPLQD